MRRRLLAGIGALLLIALPLVAFGPLVRFVAQRQANARGLVLDVGSVGAGWFAVSLGDVGVAIAEAPAVRIGLDRVRVRVGPTLSVREVVIEGGTVSLEGPMERVVEQLRAWRERTRPKADASETRAGPGLPLTLRGVNVVWAQGDPRAGSGALTGLSVSRGGPEELVAFEKAELSLPRGRLELGAFHAEIERTPTGRALRAARTERIIAELKLDSGEDTPPVGNIPTAAAPEAADPEPPPRQRRARELTETGKASSKTKTKAKAGAKTARAKSADKSQGKSKAKAKAKAVDKRQAKAEEERAPESAQLARGPWQRLLSPKARERWAALQGTIQRARLAADAALAPGARFDVASVQLRLVHEGKTLNIGSSPLAIVRDEGGVKGSFTARSDDGKQLAFEGRLPLSGDEVLELDLEGGPVSLRTLGVQEGDFGLVGVDRTSVVLETRAKVSRQGVVRLLASGRLGELAIHHEGLAFEPLTDIDVGWATEAELDLEQQRLTVSKAELDVERVKLLVALSLETSEDDVKVELGASIPRTSCQDLFGAAPRALLPDLEGLALGGTFALDTSVSLDTRSLADTNVTWNWENKCSVKKTPEAIDPQRFREPFQHFVKDADGNETEMLTGPTTENWIPFDEISRHMETALIVCEDSRFWTHRGFDPKAIQDSIAANLKAGQFVRGASTLSMQLAKNLYLGREKTLSRKLQQAALTLLLEERLSKQEILELYLNVVEFGPGVYGIGQAARHYFNTHPSELSLGQAMFLATLLPRPKQNQFAPDGSLRKHRAAHLKQLMRIAHKIHRITDEELDEGLNEQLLLGQPYVQPSDPFPFNLFRLPGSG